MGGQVFQLRLLGTPVAAVGGVPLAVDTRKAIALAAYLALEEGAHSRDTLAGLLWPDHDQDRARAALRRTLSTLRGALAALGADRVVVVDRDQVSFDHRCLELDVDEFRRLAVADDPAVLEQAVALHRGPFMAGFGLRDSVAFDDWQSFRAATLARELATVLDRTADGLAARGAVPRALESARRRLALDPLHEPAHRRLMQLYAAAGERNAALEQYRECVRVLHRELGVAPLEATTALYRAIREGSDGAASTVEPVGAAPAEPRGHPMVGRAREWRALLEAYASVSTDGRLVVIEGESGIGKSRLAAELLGFARAGGAVAIGVRSFEDEGSLAFGAVIDLLRAALRDGSPAAVDANGSAEAARLLPELGTPPTPSLADPGAQARFFEGIALTLLGATAGERPAVLLVDDVHWADSSSLDALAYLARRLRGRPILLAIAWRPEATPPGHHARRILAEAARDGLATTVSLGRLSRDDVEELVAAAGAPAGLSTRLFDETRGLPYFVVEYLDSLDDATSDWPLPTGVRDLLEARLASVGEVAAQVLVAAAVLGRAFDADLARDVSGRSDEETVTALEELTTRGIVGEVDGDAYDFRHEQARKVAYERTSLGRRRLLHRRAGEAIGLRSRGGASAGVVAQHLRLGGREAEAAEWFRLAGEHARGLYANAEALAHFREALALGHPAASALHEAIGDLQTLAGDYGAALASYEAAAAHAADGELAAIEHRIGLVHHRRGEWELADSSFLAALELAPADGTAARARIVADRSLTAHRRGRDPAAQELAEAALLLAADAGDRRALAQAHNLLGILASGRGDSVEARHRLEESLSLADAEQDPAARAAALNNLALVQRSDGKLDSALELTVEARRLAAVVGDRHREAALANNAADLLHAAGREEEAMELLKQAVALFAEIGERGVREPEIWKLVDW